MARKVVTHLIDDLDGGTADETVKFGLDGTLYEIDLSKKNAKTLRTALDKFVRSARRMARASAAGSARSRGRGSGRGGREQNQAIREWAQRKGLNVSPRGRISRSVIEQYEAQAGR
jgi:hypothetical protein